MLRRVTLVGYRACGKSSVGRALAERLGWTFRDADAAVEEVAARPIREIFRIEGEEAFRDLEEHCLNGLLALQEPQVLATGGGAVLRASSRALLRTRGGLVAYLRATPELLQERLLADGGVRPALSGGDLRAEVPEHLARRAPLYEEVADLVLDAARPVADLVEDLARRVADAEAAS